MQTLVQLFSSGLQALDVPQTGVQAAPSVSGNLKTENAETIYIQCTTYLDPLKDYCFYTYGIRFYSCAIPARHIFT